MQNLNQIRARHVLQFAKNPQVKVEGENGGEVIKKIPPVLINNGFLAALAYSMDKKQKGWQVVFDAIAAHLASAEVGLAPSSAMDAESLLDYLVNEGTDSRKLREVTVEAMAWLEFARRFV